jgi:hypothetical protein
LPILPNLLRYETFAVADYGCMSHALHLRQTRQSLKLGFALYFLFFSKSSKAANGRWLEDGSCSPPGVAPPYHSAT